MAQPHGSGAVCREGERQRQPDVLGRVNEFVYDAAGNRLRESADKLLRYKGMLWIDGEPNRLLFQGVQRLYSADWDRPWGDEKPHSTMVFIGIQLPEEEIRAAFAELRKSS